MTRIPAGPEFEPRVADWLEADPDHAPSEVLTTVLAAFPSVPQRRASRVPRRLQTMNRFVLLGAGAAIVAVVAFGGLAYRSTSPGIGAAASPPPSASAAASAVPSQVVPDGTYLGTPLPVADILTQLADDSTLTASEKTTVIDGILGIRNATTYQTRIGVDGNTWVISQGVDGTFGPESWTIVPTGANRIRANGYVDFEVGGCATSVSPCEFTLRALSEAPSPVEAFVRHLVFEMSGPFVPQR